MANRWVRWIAQMLIGTGTLPAVERFTAQRRKLVRILAYHRVDERKAWQGKLDPSLLSATPSEFAEQMRFLHDNYHVLSLDDLLTAIAGKSLLPSKSVILTFDDGYRDFEQYAWPILEQLELPAVLFVPTSFLSAPGHLFWWDQLYWAIFQTEHQKLSLDGIGTWPLRSAEQRQEVFEMLKRRIRTMRHELAISLVTAIVNALDVTPEADTVLMTWSNVGRLADSGVCIGAHTRSHPLLSRVTLNQARQEILGSQEDIKRELGYTWPIFAYPSGHEVDLQPRLSQVLQEAGFHAAVTMIEGHNVLGRTSPLLLKRVGMTMGLSLSEFRLALTGIYDVYGALLKLRAALT